MRSEIKSWGHDPVLSEYSSFPVSPELSTVDNCKRVVRERADLFILIVGGKRGSLDPQTNKSVVNSEYEEARAAGLDCIVFVEKQVWDLLPIYRKNKEFDFSPTVDNPAVFSFIEQVNEDTRWIFPFSRTEEIIDALKIQLSTRFRDLLVRSRQNRLTIPASFAGEPAQIARIAVDKGPLWEYKLACALLRDRSRKIDDRFSELELGFVVRRTKFLPGPDTIDYIQNLLDDLKNTMHALSKVLSAQLSPSFGPPGLPGDADKIKAACDNLYSLFLALFEWELDVRFVRPHQAFAAIFPKMHGWTAQMRTELRRLIAEFEGLLAMPEVSGNYTLTMTISAPEGLNEFSEEFVRMAADPNVRAAITRSI